MSQFPVIKTAIPKKRYQIAEYAVTLLGEVDSGDNTNYQYIMAFVPDGAAQPVLYVCAEKVPPNQRHAGSHQVRVVNSAMSEVVDQGDQWRDLDVFAEQALQLGMQVLGLSGETVAQLM
ncbi:MAG: hypothetical protein PVG66_05380 [Chromatiales bacterium]|jgi:hypothetical protein